MLELFFEKVRDTWTELETAVTYIFAIQKDFYQLKELERIAQKEKGISKFI